MNRKSHREGIQSPIRSWERAIQNGDMDGILAHHPESVLMVDVPEPLRSVGIERLPKNVGTLLSLRRTESGVVRHRRPAWVTAGDEVAFATGLLRIGGSAEPVCHLTVGLTKRNGRWQIVHEHHSAPHRLSS
jgi:ketosteroid isomerase-like protein